MFLGTGISITQQRGGGFDLAKMLAQEDVYLLTDPDSITLTLGSGADPEPATVAGQLQGIADPGESTDAAVSALTFDQTNEIIHAFGDSHFAGTGSTMSDLAAILSRVGAGIHAQVQNYATGGHSQAQIDAVHAGETGTYNSPSLLGVSLNGWHVTTWTIADIKSELATMVARMTTDDYVIVGPMYTPSVPIAVIQELESDLETLYPGKVVTPRVSMFASVGDDAGAYETAYTIDSVHVNAVGGQLVADQIVAHIESRGFLTVTANTGLHNFHGEIAVICSPDGWSGESAADRTLFRGAANINTRMQITSAGLLTAARLDGSSVGPAISTTPTFVDNTAKVFRYGWFGKTAYLYEDGTEVDVAVQGSMTIMQDVDSLRMGDQGVLGGQAWDGVLAVVYVHGRRFTAAEAALLDGLAGETAWSKSTWSPALSSASYITFDPNDASTVTESGGSVTALTDTGGTYTLAGNGAPALTAAAINGRSAIALDGTSDFLKSAQNFGTYRSMIVVATNDDATFSDFDGLVTGVSSGIGFIGQGTSANIYTSGAFAGTWRQNGLANNNNYLPNASGKMVYANAPSGSLDLSTGLQIGQDRSSTTRRWNGKFAYLILFSVAISSTERDRWEWYVADLFGFTLDAGHAYAASSPEVYL